MSPVDPLEDVRQFEFVLWHEDDDRKLYAADDIKHIKFYSGWVSDWVRLSVRRVRTGSPVTFDWWAGAGERPDYHTLIAAAPTRQKAAALIFERDALAAQVARSRRAGF